MRPFALLSLSLTVFLAVPAPAEQPDPVATLTGELRAHAPPEWQLRVRWRDVQLTASNTPLPYQVAFDLWYNTPRFVETLIGRCPGPNEGIWKLIRADQDVVLEPTVGGKNGVGGQGEATDGIGSRKPRPLCVRSDSDCRRLTRRISSNKANQGFSSGTW